jgi:poly-gamma-glutamate synthesis protein (capsule biosynthesis protein)
MRNQPIRNVHLIIALAAQQAGCGRSPASAPNQTVTLVAVGDVFFARGVAKQIDKHGIGYPFEKSRDIFQGADIAFCNLECPLSTRGVPQRRRYLFRCDPSYSDLLRETGFDVICLANNHTLDYGRDALLDTMDAVHRAGLTGVGAGRDRRDALTARIIEKSGLRVGFAAYTDMPTCGVVRLTDRATIAGVNADELAEQIRAAESECDVLVVSFHWGVEYMKKPTERQRALAHTCIENGADLILGHHPHVLQTVETYRGKPIVYSMGGFVWDAKIFDADKSAIYKIELGKNRARLDSIIPVDVVNCQPIPRTEAKR